MYENLNQVWVVVMIAFLVLFPFIIGLLVRLAEYFKGSENPQHNEEYNSK